MKATGIVRKVDELGRITLPIELRRTYGIEVGTPMEFYTTDDGIVVRPYRESNARLQELLLAELEREVGKTRANVLAKRITAICSNVRNEETPAVGAARESR